MEREPKILLVDDESDITDHLKPFLEREGFQIAVAGDGNQAMQTIQEFAPALIVLDILMPVLDGREVLRRLRQRGNWTPVIVLSELGDTWSVVRALEEGADDYITKPFKPAELVARMKVALRIVEIYQTPFTAAKILTCDGLETDRVSRRASLDGKALSLTNKAFNLLDYLMTHSGLLLTYERISLDVFGYPFDGDTRPLRTRISELRRQLEDSPTNPRFIKTVPGQGYIFICRVSQA